MHKFLLCALLSLTGTLRAWDFRPLQLTPSITFGYVFNAGLSFGAELHYTPIVLLQTDRSTALGVYASLNYFYSKGELYKSTWYRTASGGVAGFTNNQWIGKVGASKTVLRWGRNNMNKTKSKHWTPDLDISYSPWRNGAYIGYRAYLPGNACFGLDIKMANLIYTAYRYNMDADANASAKPNR